MKTKNALRGLAMAVVLQLGMLAGSAQTNKYLFTGSKTNITLNPGTYIITAYGAPGGGSVNLTNRHLKFGLGAEMSAEFNFSASTTLTLLVGGGGLIYGGGGFIQSGNGGGGGSFIVESNTPLVVAGGGGGEGSQATVSQGGGNGNASINGGSGYGSYYPTNRGGSYYIFSGGGGGTNGDGGAGGFDPFVCFGCGPAPSGGGGGGGFLGNGGGGSSDNGGSITSTNGGGYGGGGGGGFFDGGGGGGGGYSGGGGGGCDNYSGDGYGGGGGGSIIDPSAIAILSEVSGIVSPDDQFNGEIIITAVPTPLAIITTHAAFGFTAGVFGFNVIGPSGSNVVIQASTDLQTWMPLQTNLLGSGPLHLSDAQSPANVRRFYRVQLSP